MFGNLGAGVKSLALDAIKIVLLFVVLVAVIKWAKANPATAQQMLTNLANAAAAVITWGAGQIQQLAASNS